MGRRGAVALCVGTLLLGAGALAPRLLRASAVTSGTPVRLDAVTVPIALAPGQRVCIGGVTLDTDSERARLTLLSADAGVTRLRLTASAPAYRSEGSVPLTPAQDTARPLDVALTPPHAATLGSVCLATSGAGSVQLAGTADPRALTRLHATLDGAPQTQAFSLTLLEARERSPLARVGQLVSRAAALSPAGPWLFWLLMPLLVLGMPALVVAALALALRDET